MAGDHLKTCKQKLRSGVYISHKYWVCSVCKKNGLVWAWAGTCIINVIERFWTMLSVSSTVFCLGLVHIVQQ